MLRKGMGCAGDKDKCGERGSSWIFLVLVHRGPQKQQDMGQQHWQLLPCWSRVTHLQLLLGQHQRRPAGTRGASQTLGTMTVLLALAAAHEPPAAAPPVPAAGHPHGMPAWHGTASLPRLGERGTQILGWLCLPAFPVCPWGLAGPGSL